MGPSERVFTKRHASKKRERERDSFKLTSFDALTLKGLSKQKALALSLSLVSDVPASMRKKPESLLRELSNKKGAGELLVSWQTASEYTAGLASESVW